MKCYINSFTIYFMIGQFSIFIIFLAKLILITYFRYRVRLLEERFTVTVPKPSGWFHIVLNFIPGNKTTDVEEPSDQIRVYHDGILVGSDFSEGVGFALGGHGRIVIGQSYLPGTRNTANSYISAKVDELMFFNQSLTEAKITMLSQLTT